MMRARRLAVFAWLVGAACASPGLPPGGPPDARIPEIVRIAPDSNSVNVKAAAVLVHFDEVIAERPSGAGGGGGSGSDLSAIVSISPTDGRDNIAWRRTAIEIRPRRGFRQNTGYRVTIQPGVADLRGNVRKERTEFVFSTGATLPSDSLVGAVFDYAGAKSAPLAQVELFTPTDTAFRWRARADSTGRFTMRDLVAGSYLVRGYVDGNNDRQLGLREPYDTMRVTIPRADGVDLYAFVRDTLWPRLEAVEVIDSTALKLRFDRVVAGDWDPTDALTLLGADSIPIPLGGPLMPTVRFDSLAGAQRAAAKAASDSTEGEESGEIAEPAVLPPPPPLEQSTTAMTAADPVVRIPPPVFGRTPPVQQWSVALAEPLPPGLYRLRVIGARGLNGRTEETEREFRVR